jgi:hypothetical protein
MDAPFTNLRKENCVAVIRNPVYFNDRAMRGLVTLDTGIRQYDIFFILRYFLVMLVHTSIQ